MKKNNGGLSLKTLWSLQELYMTSVTTAAYRTAVLFWSSILFFVWLGTFMALIKGQLFVVLGSCFFTVMWLSVGLTVRLCFESWIVFYNIHNHIKDMSESLGKALAVLATKPVKQKAVSNTASTRTLTPVQQPQLTSKVTSQPKPVEWSQQVPSDLNGLVLKVF